MKVSERLAAIDRIGRELQSKYSYYEIDAYLAEFGVESPKSVSVNSKWVYVKAALSRAPLDVIARIASDLDIGSLAQMSAQSNPPTSWKSSPDFRLFISHISKEKLKAIRLKDCLLPHGVSGFVAHEDIDPTREWQIEIERALFSMDAFVAMHTPGFSSSVWTQQEIGFALGLGTKVISLKMGEDPRGFLSSKQALLRGQKPAEDIAVAILKLLAADERTKTKLALAQAARAEASNSEIPF